MTSGQVTAQLRPTIELTLEGEAGRPRTVEVTVDTGYNGEILLPPDIIQSLALASAGESPAVLADGTIVLLPMYEGHVRWRGNLRRTTIDGADSDPLVGMAFLKGHRLTVECVPSGIVIIEPIP